MKIDRKNYEIYAIDYLDGTLPEKEKAEMHAFLLVNPDLAEKLEDISRIHLDAPVLTYKKKNLLKKTETEACPDYYAIAEAEAVLSPEEIQKLGSQRLHPDFQQLVNTYRRTKLRPETAPVYPRKKELYRKPVYAGLFFRISATAALVSLFISVGTVFFRTDLPDKKVTQTSMIFTPTEPIIPKTSFSVSLPVSTPKLPDKLSPRNILPLYKTNAVPERPTVLLALSVIEEPILSLPQTLTIPKQSASEVTLYPSAQNWKPSSSFTESKNIVTSFIHAGKYLASKMKRNDTP